MLITGESLAMAGFALALTTAVAKCLIAIGKVLQRVTVLETKTELFWGAVSKTVGDMIKQPIHHRKDALVDEFNFGITSMTTPDILELKTILECELPEFEKNKDPKALAYALLLARIQQVLWTRDNGNIEHSAIRKLYDQIIKLIKGD
jgi:hypothetical protein